MKRTVILTAACCLFLFTRPLSAQTTPSQPSARPSHQEEVKQVKSVETKDKAPAKTASETSYIPPRSQSAGRKENTGPVAAPKKKKTTTAVSDSTTTPNKK